LAHFRRGDGVAFALCGLSARIIPIHAAILRRSPPASRVTATLDASATIERTPRPLAALARHITSTTPEVFGRRRRPLGFLIHVNGGSVGCPFLFQKE
jgi:hypothetical protein